MKKYLSKIIIGVIILAIIIFVGYRFTNNKNSQDVRYVTTKLKKETLTVSIDGSGQVSASNQVDIKSKVFGEILSVKIKNGQEVKTGESIVIVDSLDAQKAVRDASTNLESAQLNFQKLKEPADALSLLQSENSLQKSKDDLVKLKLTQKTNYDKAKVAIQKAQDNIEKAYEDSFNTVSNAFLDLPSIMSEIYEILYNTKIGDSEASLSNGQPNTDTLLNILDEEYQDNFQVFINDTIKDYETARANYDNNLTSYKNTSRYSSTSTFNTLLTETIETTKSIAQSVKSQSNLLDAWVDYRTQKKAATFSKVTTYQSNLSTYTGQVNSHLTSLLSIQRTLQDNKDSLVDNKRELEKLNQNNPLDMSAAEKSIKEREASLVKLKAGADKLDLRSQELTIKERQNSLWDAQKKLADYSIKAPFDGVIAKVNVKKTDSLSSSGVVATLITKQKLSTISLNEVDVSKVKLNQKVILTFDAIENLTISGKVAEIDALGTVSQGVVNYAVIIAFDTQDTRIKPGMSVSASIIVQAKNNILTVPNSAIKNQGGDDYVLVKTGETTMSKNVKIGISNDTMTEIVSGLNENDEVITQTINGGDSPTTANSNGTNRSTNQSPNMQGMMRMMR